ncbi:MAG: MFS transporter, partial [Bacteroidota bacterium]
IVFGIMVAFLSNYLIGDGSSWRLMLGVEVLPAILFVVLILGVPNSPRWLLVRRNDEGGALKVLEKINPSTAVRNLEAIKGGLSNESSSSLKRFFSGRYRLPILLAFLLALFNQISGINAVIYYAPRIFGMAGLEESASLLASVGIGAVNLAFTIAGMLLIDRAGRRSLILIGSIGYIISLGAVAYAFYTGITGVFVHIFLFLFISSHAIGQGAVIWVFISEIFPNEVRAWGNSFGSGTHWVFAALIAGIFPPVATALGPAAVFTFFAICMVGQLLFVLFMMPETKGIPLEQLQARLQARRGTGSVLETPVKKEPSI